MVNFLLFWVQNRPFLENKKSKKSDSCFFIVFQNIYHFFRPKTQFGHLRGMHVVSTICVINCVINVNVLSKQGILGPKTQFGHFWEMGVYMSLTKNNTYNVLSTCYQNKEYFAYFWTKNSNLASFERRGGGVYMSLTGNNTYNVLSTCVIKTWNITCQNVGARTRAPRRQKLKVFNTLFLGKK